MVFLQRKLRAKYVGDSQYMPNGITEGKFIPVIGFATKKRESNFDGKKEIVEDLYVVVVNNGGRVTLISAFNCQIIIDDTENNQKLLLDTLNRATMLLKELTNRVNETTNPKE